MNDKLLFIVYILAEMNQTLAYGNFYELNVAKIIGIGASFVNIFLVCPISFLIIWYERYGSAHNRTLINQFVTSTCWCSVAYTVFGQIPEVLLSIFGPFSKEFCFLHLVAKNTVLSQFLIIMTGISVVKYVYIFVIKNPSGQNDDFICFFSNLACAMNGLVYQFVMHFIPGNNSYPYYFCSGTNPDPYRKKKINYPITALTILCPLIYFIVLVKINLFKHNEKAKIIPLSLPSQSRPLPSSLSTIFQTSLADLATVAIELVITVPTISILQYLGTKDMEYLYNHLNLVYFHFHGVPLIIIGMSLLNYLVSNKKLRNTLVRELKSNLNQNFD
jgi:hypothetical protein